MKFLLIFSFGVTFTVFSPKLKSARDGIGIYHHTKFKHDVLKAVDARLLTKRQTSTDKRRRGWF